MSRTFSINSGSRDSLKVSLRWGLRANARQIRLTVAELRPQARAIDRVLHWVPPRGIDSSVRTTTCSTSSSPMERGVPDRGSSSKPSQPLRRKRRLHLPTVARVVDSIWATAWSLWPSALLRMMRAREASAWDVFWRLSQRCSCSRWSLLTVGISRV